MNKVDTSSRDYTLHDSLFKKFHTAPSNTHSPPPSANGPNPQLEQFVVDGTFKFPQIRGIPFAVLHDLDLRNRTVNLKTTV